MRIFYCIGWLIVHSFFLFLLGGGGGDKNTRINLNPVYRLSNPPSNNRNSNELIRQFDHLHQTSTDCLIATALQSIQET